MNDFNVGDKVIAVSDCQHGIFKKGDTGKVESYSQDYSAFKVNFEKGKSCYVRPYQLREISHHKVYREKDVAIIYSPSYGIGWYTAGHEDFGEDMIYDPDLVMLLLNDASLKDINDHIREKYGEYMERWKVDLEIQWIREGAIFEISVHDGYESIKPVYSPHVIKA